MRSLSADPPTPLHDMVCSQGRSLVSRPYLCPGTPGAAKCPEPLCTLKALPRASWCLAPCQWTLLHLHCSYGLRRQSSTLLVPRCDPQTPGLCRLRSAPAGKRTLPALSLRISLCVLGPLPRWLLWCLCPFLPTGQRPSPHSEQLGAPQPPYPGNFRMEPLSRLQSFAHVQARRVARHPGCAYPRARWP